ncbi:hypothetical protein [Psychrosphaera haliotis]|uniref:hypothetical protein n=1 Tax=Psychrosphaera haliotis TaxID=555083 RepID=UPI0039BFF1D5
MESELSINVVLEHNDFYIVNKPANINFHDEGDIGQGFLILVRVTLRKSYFQFIVLIKSLQVY